MPDEVAKLAEKLENLRVETVAIPDPSGETNAVYFVLTGRSAEALARVAEKYFEERRDEDCKERLRLKEEIRMIREGEERGKPKTKDVKVPILGGMFSLHRKEPK